MTARERASEAWAASERAHTTALLRQACRHAVTVQYPPGRPRCTWCGAYLPAEEGTEEPGGQTHG